MSHLHFPDGILAPWLWISGWIVVAILLFFTARRLKNETEMRKFPLAGALAAVMFLGMSFEIVPIAYHVNLSVMAGAILGPALSILVAFLVNFTLALFGHGGITVVGLNTAILSFEMILGWALLHTILAIVRKAFFAGFVSVFLTLSLSTVVAVITVFVGVPAFPGVKFFDAARFAEISFGFGAIGWLFEAWLTGALLSSFARLKPELLSSANR